MKKVIIEVEVEDDFYSGKCEECPIKEGTLDNIQCSYHRDWCPLQIKEVSQ